MTEIVELPRGIKKVAFDFDGVIGDTIPLHIEARIEAFNKFGIILNRDIHIEAYHHGASTFDIVSWAISQSQQESSPALVEQVIMLKNKLFYQLVAERSEPVKGIDALIDACYKKFGKLIVVTAELRQPMEAALERYGFSYMFDLELSVTSEDVDEACTKPDPKPYIIATERMRVGSSEVFVFEDSIQGIQSAKAAGCSVIGLDTTHTKEYLEDESEADKVMNVSEALELISKY